MRKLKISKIETLEGCPGLKHFKSFLKCCGIYMKEDSYYRKYSITAMSTGVLCLGLMSYSLYFFLNEIDKFATLAHHITFALDIVAAVINYGYYRHKSVRLIEEVNISYDYNSKLTSSFISEYEKERRKNVDFAFKCVFNTTIYTIFNVVGSAYLEQYLTGKSYALLFPTWFPLDLENMFYYSLAFLWQFLSLIFACLTIFGSLASVYIFYNHTITELKLLQFAIETTTERAEELVKTDGNISLKEAYILSVRHCGAHHTEIIDYFDNARKVLSYVYLFVFVTGFILCTSIGFTLMSDNNALKIKFSGISIIQLVFLYIACWFSESVASESENIRMAIYGIPWYDMPKECHSMFRLMIERAQRPLSFTATTGHRADMDTYMSMVKTSYSYFNMMLAAQSH